MPQPASQLQQQAARVKAEACCDAIAIRQAASLEARQLLENCHQQQEKAASEVEQIKGRAWDALMQAMKTLEALHRALIAAQRPYGASLQSSPAVTTTTL